MNASLHHTPHILSVSLLCGLLLIITACTSTSTLDPAARLRKGFVLYQSENYDEAKPLLEEAAQAGDVRAQYYLGQLYFFGKGVSRSYRQAFAWFSQAAEQQHGQAQVAVAYLYWRGYGVDRDRVEACKWLLLAERNHVPGASDKLRIVKTTMNAKQKEAAQRRADAWQPGGSK